MMDNILVVVAFLWKFKPENAAKALCCLHISGAHSYLLLPISMNSAPQYPSHTLRVIPASRLLTAPFIWNFLAHFFL